MVLNEAFAAPFGASDVDITAQQIAYAGFCRVQTLQLKHRLFGHTGYSAPLQREVVLRRPAVGVLIHDPHSKVFLLLEQFRVGALADPVSPWQLEIVAGLIDEQEQPIDAARREALEETGVPISHVQQLFQFYPSGGACNEVFTLFAASADLSDYQAGLYGAAAEGEDIRTRLFAYADIAALMQHPRLRNAPLIIALQWLSATLSD